jgi:endonuclease YncB( thermonuclease family)
MWLVLAFLISMMCGAKGEPITSGQIVVIDGDTIDLEGVRYRMVGYDTPEIKTERRAVGPKERALANKATARFTELLDAGRLELNEVRCSCTEKQIEEKRCNYNRLCAVLHLNGDNIGKTLIAEGLAKPFVCAPTKCPRLPNWPKITGDKP